MGAPARQLDPVPAPLRAPRTRPSRRPTPARPSRPGGRRRPGAARRPRLRLINRTAHAVGHIPETGLIRGIVARTPFWIFAIGILVIGIVFINVAGMSWGARAGKIETEIQQLERRNSILRSSQTRALSMPRIRHAAAAEGMTMPAPDEIRYREFQPGDYAAAAARLAAEGG